jgi:hypothetical protein
LKPQWITADPTQFKTNNASTSSVVTLRKNVEVLAGKNTEFCRVTLFLTILLVTDLLLNLTIILDPATNLPYIVRSYEQHPVFGSCTNDVQLSNYTLVDGVMFPQRFQTVYNTPSQSDAVLEDFLVEVIETNPAFPSNYFEGLSSNETETPRVAPAYNSNHTHAEVGEAFSNMIYGFEVAELGNLTISHPLADVPKLWSLMYDGSAYSQLIMEFSDGVIVADAPPQQSLQVIQWVKDKLNKPITHLWVF